MSQQNGVRRKVDSMSRASMYWVLEVRGVGGGLVS